MGFIKIQKNNSNKKPFKNMAEFSLLLAWASLSMGFPGGSAGKVSASNVGDLGLIPGSGRSPGEGNGNPL